MDSLATDLLNNFQLEAEKLEKVLISLENEAIEKLAKNAKLS